MKDGAHLLNHLIHLCNDLAMNRETQTQELFELTKSGQYPAEVVELAEAFGMMLVRLEARDYQREEAMEKLKVANMELAEAKRRLARDNAQLKKNLGKQLSPKQLVGHSKPIRDILHFIDRIADTPVNVLITGETGTGKGLVAKVLHYNSSRADGPFVGLNCSALPEHLVESELFGISKGTATGVEARQGLIQSADGGTLFLDEISSMSLPAQAKILKVLDEREVRPVGGRNARSVDVRVVAASNSDMLREVEEGRFRSDLYYRINVVKLDLPPLRDRSEDVPLLLKNFLGVHSQRFSKPGLRFAPGVVKALSRYSWPGNVRQLQNEVERVVALATDETIDLDLFSQAVTSDEPQVKGPTSNLEEMEKDLILRVLDEAGNNKAEAARRLGISREGLRKKLKRFNLA